MGKAKGGGTTAHRATLKQVNKPFKGKKKSGKKSQPTPGIKVSVAKKDKKNADGQRKKLKIQKVKERIQAEKESSTPKLFVVIPFHPSADIKTYASQLIKFLCLELLSEALATKDVLTGPEERKAQLESEANEACLKMQDEALRGRIVTVGLPSWAGRRRRKLQLYFCDIPQEAHSIPLANALPVHLDALDICKAADGIVALFGTTSEEAGTSEPRAFSTWGYDFLSLLRRQGLPSIVGVSSAWSDPIKGRSWNTDSVKQRAIDFDIVKRCYLTEILDGSFFDVSTMISLLSQLDAKELMATKYSEIPRKATSELINLIRHVAEADLGAYHWREAHGYMAAESFIVDAAAETLSLIGFFRGQGFTCQLPVHVTGLGDFPLQRIDLLQPGVSLGPDALCQIDQIEDEERFLKVWNQSTTEDLASATSEEGEDVGDADMLTEAGDDDALEEMADDITADEEDEETQEWVQSLQETQEEARNPDLKPRTRNEMQFDDEVDTPYDQPCRERFAKYRGLRSFKNSSWDISLDHMPPWYSSIVDLKPYKQIIKQIRNKTAELLAEAKQRMSDKKLGTYGVLTLKIPDVSMLSAIEARLTSKPNQPLIVSTLGLAERKLSIQHMLCAKTPEMGSAPLPSKSRVLLQCGFRRIEVKPLFSIPRSKGNPLPVEVGDPTNHKLAYKRYMPEAERLLFVGSYLGPIVQSPNAPVIGWLLDIPTKMMEEVKEKCELDKLAYPEAGTPAISGHFVTTDCQRLIIRRILLTGYPHRIKKKMCSVRRMFFNRADVQHYMPIHVFAKTPGGSGKAKEGKITESLGTHGDMKCVFTHQLNHSETVCLPLYRRVVPPQ
eukprot:Blabericola_migrator_1__8578@NODE_448_length_8373_cov_125_949193_g350_i0_p2_GENE_NODE_448_length_8373_cov_125_949193_g350_i0NODE_448_length_8373_cov_125_949193_g350_i0_p2_ORF_typecomplete_len840_score169_63RIBIOP_C/PF04950_12/5_5e03RIBIOP_C/PF04950_12/4_1e53AARP2CN/PF08142_12/1e12DUF1033/PF06279_11/0_059_NODE_448_length_8373_cov_125_949193_g350_i037616280